MTTLRACDIKRNHSQETGLEKFGNVLIETSEKVNWLSESQTVGFVRLALPTENHLQIDSFSVNWKSEVDKVQARGEPAGSSVRGPVSRAGHIIHTNWIIKYLNGCINYETVTLCSQFGGTTKTWFESPQLWKDVFLNPF